VITILVVSFLSITASLLVFLIFKKIKKELITKINDDINLRKWSSIGQMAGGIAHEVNSPLAAMLLTLESIPNKMDRNEIDKVKRDISTLIRTGEKISNIIQSLRLLTLTGGKFERDKVCLFDVFIKIKNEFQEKFKVENVTFDYMYNVKSDGQVWGSSAALLHVVGNLVKNAYDATSSQKERWIKMLLLETTTHYKILVQNNGPQIDRDSMEKIFEPFFTTKAVGSAMGIGLSISKTLILAHSGAIRVDPQNPHVTFEILLPKIKEDILKDNATAA
jgi:C4-dicarboxylate-specific signal transduction histidine kinase